MDNILQMLHEMTLVVSKFFCTILLQNFLYWNFVTLVEQEAAHPYNKVAFNLTENCCITPTLPWILRSYDLPIPLYRIKTENR